MWQNEICGSGPDVSMCMSTVMVSKWRGELCRTGRTEQDVTCPRREVRCGTSCQFPGQARWWLSGVKWRVGSLGMARFVSCALGLDGQLLVGKA
jgi:hypothetical protein